MSLRAGLEELAEQVPVYGDLDRAIERADHERRRTIGLGAAAVAAAAALAVVVSGIGWTRHQGDEQRPVAPPTATPTGSVVRALPDGLVTPGRYRYVVQDTCDPAMGCPTEAQPNLPDITLSVPAGWRADNGVHLVVPATRSATGAPDGAGLVLGWTNAWVGLYSRPCQHGVGAPDMQVGPTVDDFVHAVTAHPRLDVSEPRPVRLGQYRGQLVTLTAPSDISGCSEWRPWDPSPYAQGPGNRWDLWVMDVDGVRVVVMAGYYPGTPASTKAELRAMAASVRFVPPAPRG